MRIFRLPSYQFQSEALLNQALTHRGLSNHNNERLEFLGDAILDMVISRHLYEIFPSATEGQLSQLRSNLVKKDTLARIARAHNIGEFIHFGPGELKTGAHRRSSVLADTVEALIAAAYIDSNHDFESCQNLVLALYSSELANLSLEEEQKDNKTLLQEWLQARKQDLPKYRLVQSAGKDHQKSFTVQCMVPGVSETFTATESSKRKAEQLAARSALEFLMT